MKMKLIKELNRGLKYAFPPTRKYVYVLRHDSVFATVS